MEAQKCISGNHKVKTSQSTSYQCFHYKENAAKHQNEEEHWGK